MENEGTEQVDGGGGDGAAIPIYQLKGERPIFIIITIICFFHFTRSVVVEYGRNCDDRKSIDFLF